LEHATAEDPGTAKVGLLHTIRTTRSGSTESFEKGRRPIRGEYTRDLRASGYLRWRTSLDS
jgi:hypothetical protein